jgi:UDPglucose--hexose-1-phosphate uridylyltransferase
MNNSEMRLDPLRQSWTIFSKSRLATPPLIRTGPTAPAVSPFARGNEELTPPALYTRNAEGSDKWQMRVIPNRAPIFRVEGDHASRADGFYDHMDALGAHEVIVEDPGGGLLEDQPLPDMVRVIEAWKLRMLDLSRDMRMRAFFIVKNSGAPSGATVAHSVSQLIAMAVVPPALRRKLESAREFYEIKKRSVFGDILEEEFRTGTRLVYENNGFTVFCPYASRTPFEMAVYPKRQCADFHGISDQEMAQFADVMKMALLKMNCALDRPAYNFLIHTAPSRTPRRDQWNTIEQDFRWHAEIVPRVDYTGGFELATGCHVNTVWPEEAADHMRKIEL